MPTLQGTLLLPNGTPLANANIVLIADRNEGTNIVKGVSSEFSTNASGAYSQSVEPGLYSVKLEHQQRTRTLGKIFIDPTTNSSLEVLLASTDDAETVTVTALQTFLSDTQAAADSAAQSADDAINALAENQAQLDAFIEQAQSDVDEAISASNAAVADNQNQLGAFLAQAQGDVTELINASGAAADSANQAANNANSAAQSIAADLTEISERIPLVNLLRYSRGVLGTDSRIYAFEQFPSFLVPFNGASPISEVGKFIDDNSDYGGNRGFQTEAVTSFLSKSGRPNLGSARYGVEFYFGEIIAGSGTFLESENFPGFYILFNSTDQFVGVNASLSIWLRCVSGQMVIDHNSVFINGNSEIARPYSSADGWNCFSIRAGDAYLLEGRTSMFPYIFVSPNTVVQLTMPVLKPNAHSRIIHTAPILSEGLI